ncbi:MAG: efflux RND transporter periplasmic adaptor subunit [Candidatus Obscuribacter sp.]|nr:efflux RND transporter periplasmic adaptor subunit [Candidatus Obscuribacter sp.]
MFQLAKIDRLRIYVNAPQRVARYLKKGMVAQVMVPEYPDGNYKGVVTNISGGLDPNTRTRQTEIQIDNKDHALFARHVRRGQLDWLKRKRKMDHSARYHNSNQTRGSIFTNCQGRQSALSAGHYR